MAKPKLPSPSEHSATSSTNTRHSSTSNKTSYSRPGSQRHRSKAGSAPSSSLLAILATVAASTPSADGLPIPSYSQPPDFLCPFLFTQDSTKPSKPRRNITKRDLPEAIPADYLSRLQRSGFVPDKYVQGDDGRWRKSDWSLYGSAYCKCPSIPEDTSVPVVDDQVQTTQIPSTTTNTAPAEFDMESSLPQGWKPRAEDDHISTSIILVLSLVLAFLMCIFIIGCVTWRRKRRRLLERDLEKKERLSRDDSDDEFQGEESEEVRRMKSQQRMWSKATARWKANVRLSARRRRGKRQAALHSSSAHSSSHSLHILPSPSLNQSRPTVASVNPEGVDMDSASAHHEDPPEDAHPDSNVPDLSSPPSSHPPAYNRATVVPSSSANSAELSDPPGAPPDEQCAEEQLPYSPPADGAHVATDDKHLLSHLASLASEPPSNPSSLSPDLSYGTTSEPPLATVPAMEEVEENEICLACLGQNSSEVEVTLSTAGPFASTEDCPPVPSYQHEHHSPRSAFPPPPSKSSLASAPFYEYPTSFEADVVGIDPVEGPSAPPFESIGPSAPPLDDDQFMDTIPSAPPIPLDDHVEQRALAHPDDDVPSAPIIDDEILMSALSFPASSSESIPSTRTLSSASHPSICAPEHADLDMTCSSDSLHS